MSTEHSGALKEGLCRYREKLHWIRGSVSIKERRYSGLIGSAQRRKLRPHHFAPGQLLLARRQCRRSIIRRILVVKLVSKLMQDDVFAIGRISRTGFDRIPCEYHSPQPPARLAQASHSSFFPHGAFDVPFFFCYICRRIDKNCEQAREVVGLAVQ